MQRLEIETPRCRTSSVELIHQRVEEHVGGNVNVQSGWKGGCYQGGGGRQEVQRRKLAQDQCCCAGEFFLEI